MPQESLGFVKLEWTCPKCSSRNPGPQKTCSGCGAPQPDNVKFEQAERQELVKDEAEIKQAKAGPDIHCPFCGTRNAAGTATCTQCGGDLVEGTLREVGQVIGAHTTGPVREIACPRCAAPNLETAHNCTKCGAPLTKTPEVMPAAAPAQVPAKQNRLLMVAGIVIAVVCLCAVVVMLMNTFKTEGKNGVVQDAHWVSIIQVEAQRPVRRQDWRNEIPAEATIGNCTEKLHNVQDEPAPNSVKVCGTPYEVETGSGFAEVVQDCQYEVYQDYCEYTVMEWTVVNEFSLEGEDYSPAWPEVQLSSSEERQGERNQVFTVVFETADGRYEYVTSDFDLFQRLQLGSEWVLNINGLGQIVSIEPVQ